MTESRARRDLDFDYLLDDPDGNDGWFGQALPADAVDAFEANAVEAEQSCAGRKPDIAVARLRKGLDAGWRSVVRGPACVIELTDAKVGRQGERAR